MVYAIICLSVCGLCVAFVWVRSRYVRLVNELVPVCPGKLPILGHLLNFINPEALYTLSLKFGKFTFENGGVSVFFCGVPFYVVTDPDDVSTVLQKCLKKSIIYKLVEPLLGKMLVAAEVPVWKRSRRIIDLGFKQHLFDDYLAVFNKAGDHLVKALAEDVGKAHVDVTHKVARIFLETACRTTLGSKMDGQDLVSDEYVAAIDTFMEVILIKFCQPWYLLEPVFNLSSYKKKFDKAIETFTSLSKEMIQLRKAEHLQRLKDNNVNRQDDRIRSFLDVLIENSVTETASTFEDVEMRNLVDNVLVAAFDTTITTMVLILVCLGTHPEVQEKIYQEIIDVLGEDGDVSKENHSKLVFLEAAIKEAIRLYPIASVIGREATSDVKLRNYTLPAGSQIMVHIWGTNMNPKYWGADAEKFKPERWFSDSLPEHPAAFASFSPGRRGCTGKFYTLTLFKAVLVPIIRRYKLTADRTKLDLALNVMLKPRSGHHISIQYR